MFELPFEIKIIIGRYLLGMHAKKMIYTVKKGVQLV